MFVINYQPLPQSNQNMTDDDLTEVLSSPLTDDEIEMILLHDLIYQAKEVCSIADSKNLLPITSNALARLISGLAMLQNRVNDYELHQQKTMEM